MSQGELFEMGEAPGSVRQAAIPLNQIRVVRPVRGQVEWVMRNLDEAIAEDHPVRAIWEFLERLELSAFYSKLKATLDRPGRPASDPRVLLALWIYATTDGVGSARRLDKLCHEHDAYRWLCGGVPVDYHLLAEFRVSHQEALNRLMSEIIAALMANDLVSLKRVAQDGLRVRAKAGKGSFRGAGRLAQYLAEAEAQVEELSKQREHPDPRVNSRERAARQRAAKERVDRVTQALEQLPAVQAAKQRQAQDGKKVNEAKVSTTDAEARVMKMPDGGFRPAYNVQIASDPESQVVLGIAVSNVGADQGQAVPMQGQVYQRTGKHPGAYLMDGGYVSLDDVVTLEGSGIEVFMPPSPKRVPEDKPGKRVAERMDKEPTIRHWWERMRTEEGKAVYRKRAKAEAINALFRERYGLRRFLVTGRLKTLCTVFLLAITHNLLRWIALS